MAPSKRLPALDRRALTALALDVVVVAVFTLIGRRTHDEPLDLLSWWSTGWPFLTGLLLGWALVALTRRVWAIRVTDGVIVWLATVVIGMALRALTDQGTALPFVVVATLFLGATLLGWRALQTAVRRRRARV